MEASGKREGTTVPYVSWLTFLGVIERMEPPGIVPTQIDATFLKTYAGSVQRLLLHTFRVLRLIDAESGEVLDSLKELVNRRDDRPKLIRGILEAQYPWALTLSPNATEQQLLTVFAEHGGVEGETRRKAIAFFLAAADYADLVYSPLWKRSRGRPPTGGPAASRRGTGRRSRRTGPRVEAVPPPAAVDGGRPATRDQMAAAYFNLLLEKAQKDQTIDADLADRIEALLGVAKTGAMRDPATEPSPKERSDEGGGEET